MKTSYNQISKRSELIQKRFVFVGEVAETEVTEFESATNKEKFEDADVKSAIKEGIEAINAVKNAPSIDAEAKTALRGRILNAINKIKGNNEEIQHLRDLFGESFEAESFTDYLHKGSGVMMPYLTTAQNTWTEIEKDLTSLMSFENLESIDELPERLMKLLEDVISKISIWLGLKKPEIEKEEEAPDEAEVATDVMKEFSKVKRPDAPRKNGYENFQSGASVVGIKYKGGSWVLANLTNGNYANIERSDADYAKNIIIRYAHENNKHMESIMSGDKSAVKRTTLLGKLFDVQKLAPNRNVALLLARSMGGKLTGAKLDEFLAKTPEQIKNDLPTIREVSRKNIEGLSQVIPQTAENDHQIMQIGNVLWAIKYTNGALAGVRKTDKGYDFSSASTKAVEGRPFEKYLNMSEVRLAMNILTTGQTKVDSMKTKLIPMIIKLQKEIADPNKNAAQILASLWIHNGKPYDIKKFLKREDIGSIAANLKGNPPVFVDEVKITTTPPTPPTPPTTPPAPTTTSPAPTPPPPATPPTTPPAPPTTSPAPTTTPPATPPPPPPATPPTPPREVKF